jgi:hypothetical protein
MPGKHYSTEQRRFIKKSWTQGWKVATIILAVSYMRQDAVAPTRKTIYNILDNPTEKKKWGRTKKKISPGQSRAIFKLINKESKQFSVGVEITAAYIRDRCNLNCGLQTIRDELHRKNYFWLRPRRALDLSVKDKRQRKEFCAQWMDKSPSQLKRAFGLVLDEKSFHAAYDWKSRMYALRKGVRGIYGPPRGKAGKGRKNVITRPGTLHAPSRGGKKKASILGGIGSTGVILWAKYTGAMTATKFTSPSCGVEKCLKKNAIRKIYMDNARPHAAKKTLKWLQGLRATAVATPRRSPDLNPMDFAVWTCVKNKMMRGDIRLGKRKEPKEKWLRRLRNAAKNIGEDQIGKIWIEFRDRLRRCYEHNGGHFPEHRLMRL